MRTGSVSDAAGPEPSDGAGGCSVEVPSMLMHESVVERADERQVVEVGRAAA